MKNNTRWISLLAVMALVLAGAAVAQQKSDDKAVDPVCGMTVVKAAAKAAFDYKGTKYYFCSTGCKDAFAKEPEKYLAKKPVEVREKEAAKECACGKEGMAGQKHAMGGMRGMGMMGHPGRMGMMPGPMMGGVNRLLLRRDVDWTFEKTADGVTLKITAKDPETVKAIQERLAMAKELKETMVAPAGADKGKAEHSCENCPMKKAGEI